MWDLKAELTANAAAHAKVERLIHETADLVERIQRMDRKATQIGVAPQAAPVPRAQAWAPVVAAGLGPRPDGRVR